MSSASAVYMLVFGLVFVPAFALFMVTPIWVPLGALVLGTVALFWWIRKW